MHLGFIFHHYVEASLLKRLQKYVAHLNISATQLIVPCLVSIGHYHGLVSSQILKFRL